VKNWDRGLKIYMTVLILSWFVIIAYLIHYENTHGDDFYKKELESYPYDHSKITDSTLKNGKQ
jgi:hypothetical protein